MITEWLPLLLCVERKKDKIPHSRTIYMMATCSHTLLIFSLTSSVFYEAICLSNHHDQFEH